MNNMTIIVPLVEYNEEHKYFLERMWKSVLSTEVANVIFVGPSSAISEVKKFEMPETMDVLYLENNKNTELQFQINKAVKDVKTDYFSILEFDDAYTSFWFNNVETYIEAQPETSLFLPLIEILDYEHLDVGPISYANEPVWASFFSDEIGCIDNASLQNFFNFIISGGVFKKSDFLSVGGLKCNIKIFFWYELLLRMTHNDKKVYVIPKIGCEHIVNRKDSLTAQFAATEQDEVDFWFETAKEEHLYKTDRKKAFVRE
jgi:hypothetical protein